MCLSYVLVFVVVHQAASQVDIGELSTNNGLCESADITNV